MDGWRQQRISTFSSKRQLAWHRLGVCLHKAWPSGRVDVYTQGKQGSVCRNNAQMPLRGGRALCDPGPGCLEYVGWLRDKQICVALQAPPSYVYLVDTRSLHVASETRSAPIVFGDHDSCDAVGLCLLACPVTTRLRSA